MFDSKSNFLTFAFVFEIRLLHYTQIYLITLSALITLWSRRALGGNFPHTA